MFPLPHARVPVPVQRVAGSVIAIGDLQNFRKKCVTATRPVQQFETFLLGP